MLKHSRYNYIIYNKKNELLMANTYSGYMVKVSENNAAYAKSILECEKIIDKNSIILKMEEAGLLIDEDEDEDIRLQDSYLEMQSSPILTLILLPTEECNFRCVYCPEDFTRGRMSEDVQNAIIQLVKQNINSYTGVRVSWFGGEPLMARDIIANLSKNLMKICNNANRSYTASITTNAYLLSYDVFLELLSYNILHYQITIDGLEKTHNAQRPLINKESTYDRIISNLLEIKEKSKTGKFSIFIRTNFTNGMISEMYKYFNWYNDTFANDMRFKILIARASNYGGERINNITNNLISKNHDEEIFFDAILNSNIHKIVMINRRFFRRGGEICDASKRNSVVIDAEGNIRKCTCKLNDDKINRMGNILVPDILKRISSSKMQWNILALSDKCKKCFYSPICMGMSCMYANIKKGVAVCPEGKVNINYYLYIYDKQGCFKYID